MLNLKLQCKKEKKKEKLFCNCFLCKKKLLPLPTNITSLHKSPCAPYSREHSLAIEPAGVHCPAPPGWS